MKRILVFAVAALVAVGSAFADEKVLIDFSLLTAEDVEVEVAGETQTIRQNAGTLIDLTNQAGRFGTPAQKAAAKSSLAIENWRVELTSSAQSLENKRLSRTAEAPTLDEDAGRGTVMGVRIHFPLAAYNSSAVIKPPFEIPAFDREGEDGADRFSAGKTADDPYPGKGIIQNVGAIKSVQAEVFGLNFPHKLSVILQNHLGEEKIVPLGSLNYEGWAKLTWNNPQYVTEVRNRDLRLYSLYPQSQTFLRFVGFIVQKGAADVGGDFIAYFKEVRVIYDQAVLEVERDIDDEAIWGIIGDRETNAKDADQRRFGERAVQEYLDDQRQAKQTYDAHGNLPEDQEEDGE
jgi:hypothetical protein